MAETELPEALEDPRRSERPASQEVVSELLTRIENAFTPTADPENLSELLREQGNGRILFIHRDYKHNIANCELIHPDSIDHTSGTYVAMDYTITEGDDGVKEIEGVPKTYRLHSGEQILPALTDEEQQLANERYRNLEERSAYCLNMAKAKEAARIADLKRSGKTIVSERTVDELQFILMSSRPIPDGEIPI